MHLELTSVWLDGPVERPRHLLSAPAPPAPRPSTGHVRGVGVPGWRDPSHSGSFLSAIPLGGVDIASAGTWSPADLDDAGSLCRNSRPPRPDQLIGVWQNVGSDLEAARESVHVSDGEMLRSGTRSSNRRNANVPWRGSQSATPRRCHRDATRGPRLPQSDVREPQPTSDIIVRRRPRDPRIDRPESGAAAVGVGGIDGAAAQPGRHERHFDQRPVPSVSARVSARRPPRHTRPGCAARSR
jgi:hypothetical protein